MATIGALTANLDAETAAFKRDLGKAVGQLNTTSKRMNKSLAGMERSWRLVSRSVIAFAGPAVLGLMIKRSIDAADAAKKTADRLGLTTEAFTGLAFAFERANISIQTGELALQRMTRRVAEAGQGTGEAVKALKDLRLSAVDLAAQSPDQQFLTIADALSKVSTQGDRVRLAFKLFDSEGVKVLNTMNRGREGIEEMMQQAQNLGIVISSDFAANAEAFKTSTDLLSGRAGGFVNQITNDILPTLTSWIERLNVLTGAQDSFSAALLNTELRSLESELALVVAGQGAFADASGLGNRQLEREAELIEKITKLRAEATRVASAERAGAVTTGGGGGGGSGPAGKNPFAGVGNDQSFELFLEGLREREEALRESQLTRRELELIAFGERNAQLLEALAFDQVSEDQFRLAREELERAHQARLTDIANSGVLGRREFEQATLASKLQTVVGFGAKELAAVANSNKTLFKIQKAFALAELALSMPAAIGAAIERGGGLPWGAVFGAITAAKYVALIAQAKSAKFGGSTSPASVAGGGAAPVFQPTNFQQPAATPVREPLRDFNIQIIGDSFSAEQMRDKIIPELIDAFSDGAGRNQITVSLG